VARSILIQSVFSMPRLLRVVGLEGYREASFGNSEGGAPDSVIPMLFTPLRLRS
jgi:hypothetical protein